jgi:hypothetical protein
LLPASSLRITIGQDFAMTRLFRRFRKVGIVVRDIEAACGIVPERERPHRTAGGDGLVMPRHGADAP